MIGISRVILIQNQEQILTLHPLHNNTPLGGSSVTRKKLPHVYKSCLKMISVAKWSILTPFQKLPKNVGDLGKLIVAKGFKKLPNVANAGKLNV